MKIDSVELYLVNNKFSAPWRTAYGSDEENCVVMARLISGSHEGWGEASPLPCPTYCSEWGESAFEVASRFLAPSVVGREMPDYKAVNNAMSYVKGNAFAKAAIEIAWWNLQADISGVPLHKLFGGSCKKTVVEGPGVGICDSFDDLIKSVGLLVEGGAPRVKLKAAHGWDIDMIAAVRSTFPSTVIHIDCNSSYDRSEIDVFKKMDKYNLAMIEQPFAAEDLVGHSILQSSIETPLCLDESIKGVLECVQAAELKACKYVNIKPARVGGLGNSLEINRICAENGIGCWVGGMMESDVGKSVCVELASVDNMVYPADLAPELDNYKESICVSQLERCAPYTFPVSENIGNPIKPNIEKMLKKTVKSTVIK